MRTFLLALVVALSIIGISHSSHATCPTPNPNNSPGTPPNVAFVDDCAVPAASLNSAINTAASLNNASVQRIGIDVKASPYNATGNGGTDDTAAIQSAIAALPATGGSLIFGPGTYCVKTGPLTVTIPGVTFLGRNRQQATVLSTCGADKSILAMSGAHDVVDELAFVGSQSPGTTKDVIQLNAGCNECTLNDVRASGGRYALNATNAYEIYVLDSSMDSTYGGAIVYITGTGGYIRKGKFDQAYPYATPSAGTTTFPVPAWVSSHSYSAGALVSSSGYILQATVAGTSGSSAPATPTYSTPVTDNTVTWGLVGATTYYGIQCDTACGFQLYITDSDFSADETAGIGITNTLAGAAPHGVVISNDTFGSNLYNNITSLSGYFLQITNNIFGGGLAATGSAAISLAGSGDDNIVAHNIIDQGGATAGATGVFLNANNVNIEDNICSVQTCVSVAANINHFRIIGNSCFSGFGASGTCVFINNGTSDYYDVIGNDGGGTSTSIFDGGTGVHKTLLDSVTTGQYSNTLNQHLTISNPKPSIASGFGSSPSITGSDQYGRITVGSGGASSGVITLGSSFHNFPSCTANDETSSIGTRVAATAANQLTFGTLTGSWSAADTITYVCGGY